ncbi:MAG: hypothetical protein KGH87_08355 [Thaumarchaeota archaeon]|nr:hypothetical protein [Nitrososphaerota archaeon]
MIKPLNWADVVNNQKEQQERLARLSPDIEYDANNAFHNVVFRKINEIIEKVNAMDKMGRDPYGRTKLCTCGLQGIESPCRVHGLGSIS